MGATPSDYDLWPLVAIYAAVFRLNSQSRL